MSLSNTEKKYLYGEKSLSQRIFNPIFHAHISFREAPLSQKIVTSLVAVIIIGLLVMIAFYHDYVSYLGSSMIMIPTILLSTYLIYWYEQERLDYE